MRLELDNVGKISSANIELNGITVIAGENNTGKSTIGKMLFCVFSAFYKFEEQIREELIKSISGVLNGLNYEIRDYIIRNYEYRAEHIVGRKDYFLADKSLIIKEIEDLLVSKDVNFRHYIGQEVIENLADKIYMILKLEESEVQKIILRKRLEAEFAMKVGHVNMADQKASVKLNIKGDDIAFAVVKNEDIEISDYMNLNKEIIYMDDPFVLDNLGMMQWHAGVSAYEHRQVLIEKLANAKKAKEFSVIDELVVQKKLERILEKMQGVCDGSIMADENNTFVYKTDKLNGNLEMTNLSTGLKSFAILRRLLQNGNIDENGIIILDEPEIHLHPEWQLKFAEIIVLVQKEFKTNILLNTHSPYFLNAIEVYSQKYGIGSLCKFYLADENNGITHVVDVTDETERIYAKLAKPLQELENVEYGDIGV